MRFFYRIRIIYKRKSLYMCLNIIHASFFEYMGKYPKQKGGVKRGMRMVNARDAIRKENFTWGGLHALPISESAKNLSLSLSVRRIRRRKEGETWIWWYDVKETRILQRVCKDFANTFLCLCLCVCGFAIC